MLGKYILDANGNPVVCNDLIEWATWYESARDRRVAFDQVGEVKISTVFLGLDHNFAMTGPPILWETMIFGGPFDREMYRYTTRDLALIGHADALLMVKTTMRHKQHV
jgi:hypothetical protein